MMKALPGLLLFGLNLTGVAAYLALAARGWRESAEGGAVPITMEPFIWALCLPVLLVFVLVNVTWGALLIRRKIQERLSFFATVAVWAAALVLDFSHH